MNNDILFSVKCYEPEGEIVRNVRALPLSVENLKLFWDKARVFKTLFAEEINDDFDKFVAVFLEQSGDRIDARGLFWVVDDFVGIFYLTKIDFGHDAMVHYTFLDRRHRGRIPLVRAMIKYVFDTYEFVRLSAAVPKYASEHSVIFIKKRLGFREEGLKRKGAKFAGQFFDVSQFGLLRDETNAWSY